MSRPVFLKDFIPTSPWLINTSVVAGDQNDEDGGDL